MDESDHDLVMRALAGEGSAFDLLVSRHRPALLRFAAYMIGDADEAESLAQEALARAYAQLAGFRRDLAFGPWVHGIALNLCRNHLRDRTRHAKLLAPEQLDDVREAERRGHGVLSGIVRQEVGEFTLQAIGQLPIPMREAFVLHYVEGLDYAQMSEITGLTAGTLRVRAHRARTLLRHSLGSVVDTWLRECGQGKD